MSFKNLMKLMTELSSFEELIDRFHNNLNIYDFIISPFEVKIYIAHPKPMWVSFDGHAHGLDNAIKQAVQFIDATTPEEPKRVVL